MLNYFPILPLQAVQEYTDAGYLLVFRSMRAIGGVHPKDTCAFNYDQKED